MGHRGLSFTLLGESIRAALNLLYFYTLCMPMCPLLSLCNVGAIQFLMSPSQANRRNPIVTLIGSYPYR